MIASTFAIIVALAALCICSPRPAQITTPALMPWDPAPASSFIAIASPINTRAEAIMADRLPGVDSDCCFAIRECFAEKVYHIGFEYSDFECLAHAAKTCGPVDRAAEMRLCMQPVLQPLRDFGARGVGEFRIVPVPPVKSDDDEEEEEEEEEEENRHVDVVVVTLTITNMVTQTVHEPASTMECTTSISSETSTPTPIWTPTPTVTSAPPSEESDWQGPSDEDGDGDEAWDDGAWGEGREWKGRRRSVEKKECAASDGTCRCQVGSK